MEQLFQEWFKNKAGNPLWCFSKDNLGLDISGEEFDRFDLCKRIIPIEASEFDLLCRVLECIYDD